MPASRRSSPSDSGRFSTVPHDTALHPTGSALGEPSRLERRAAANSRPNRLPPIRLDVRPEWLRESKGSKAGGRPPAELRRSPAFQLRTERQPRRMPAPGPARTARRSFALPVPSRRSTGSQARPYRAAVGLRPPPDGPPGWYPSLLGPEVYRFWDGENWHTAVWDRGESASERPAAVAAGYPVHRADLLVGSSRQERTAARDDAVRAGADQLELRALDGDPMFDDAVWVRGHLVHRWRPEIDQLNREGRLGGALELACECMEAVEHERPLPWGWAWEVAVIARKMRRYDLEVAVIERVLALTGVGAHPAEQWDARLTEAKALDTGSRRR